MNCFSVLDEEYISSQETDYLFLSENFRKK